METPGIVQGSVQRGVHHPDGADVITTNSYALVPFVDGEEKFRSKRPGERLIALAGRLAREAADGAADRKVLVAGSNAADLRLLASRELF